MQLKSLFLALWVGASAALAGNLSSVPACKSNCWENSKYVTACADETQCLCEDANFQNAVYQCLHSQCPTAHFGPALHHALSECSAYTQPGSRAPPLIALDNLRKRSKIAGYGTRSVTASATRSARHASASASAYSRPKRSARQASYVRRSITTATPASAIL